MPFGWVVAGKKGIDRGQTVDEPVFEQEFERPVDRRRSRSAGTAAHPFQKIVGLDRSAGLDDVAQGLGADRREVEPALAADPFDHPQAIGGALGMLFRSQAEPRDGRRRRTGTGPGLAT